MIGDHDPISPTLLTYKYKAKENSRQYLKTHLYDIAVRIMPKTIKMEAIMMRIVLQLAEMKTPPMVIPVPDPSSLDSTLSRLIIPEPRLEPGRLLEDCW